MSVIQKARPWALAVIACLAVCAPTIATVVAPFVCAAVFLTRKPLSLRLNIADCLAIAIPAWAAASALWSVEPAVSLRAAVSYAIMAGLFVAIRSITTIDELRIAAIGYLIGCVVLIARIGYVALADQAVRHNMPDVNANYAGYALVLGFAVLVLVWKTTTRTRLLTAASIAISAVFIGGILLTETRGAFGGLLMLALWLTISRFLPTPPIKTLTALAGVAAVMIVSGLIDEAARAVESLSGRSTGDWSGRLYLWPDARAWWLDHFIIGSGASTFQGSGGHELGAHNLVLELGTGMGVVGVALFVALLWFVLRNVTPILLGCFICTTALSYLTGHWEITTAGWIALGVFSAYGSTNRVADGMTVRDSPGVRMN